MRRMVTVESLAPVPYSYAAVAPAGTVFTAGACPLDEHGKVVAPGDIPAQTRRVLENLSVTLRAADCDFEDVVKTTVYVATDRRADLVDAWHEIERAFGADMPPSTLIGVAVLGWPEQLVEVEAVAARRASALE